jgi:hypothetical protein
LATLVAGVTIFLFNKNFKKKNSTVECI